MKYIDIYEYLHVISGSSGWAKVEQLRKANDKKNDDIKGCKLIDIFQSLLR